jgi:hypothetical protein
MRKRTEPRMWGSVLGHRPQSPSASASGAAVRHEAQRRAAAGDEIIEQAKKRDALVTVEHRSHLIEECHRRAAEARRLADTPSVSLDERDDLLVVERRWLSLAGRIEPYDEFVGRRYASDHDNRSRPMSSAPLDGTPVRLFASLGSAIASFWTAERSRKAFGAGDYRAGWFLLDDDAVELNNPMGWEPLTHEIDR